MSGPEAERESERAALRLFLSEHDAVCPSCGYGLRGLALGRCPECERPVRLAIDSAARWGRMRWPSFWAAVACAAYAGITTGIYAQGLWAATRIGPLGGTVAGNTRALFAPMLGEAAAALWFMWLAAMLQRKRRDERRSELLVRTLMWSFVVWHAAGIAEWLGGLAI